MSKIFSVIIATYNAAETLERSLLSVISQKENYVELIVADGGSTDGTLGIIDRYRDHIDVFFSAPDEGVYDAWNKAIARSHGEWILFLGADDYYAPDFFAKYLDFMASNDISDIDLISAKCQLFNKEGKKLRIFGAPYCWEEFRNKNRLSHGSALHSRKFLEEVGPFSLLFKISADYELLLRRPLKTLFMDEVIFYMQDGGMSYSAKGLIQTFQVKRFRHSSSLVFDIYYLVKGLTGFYVRKALWALSK